MVKYMRVIALYGAIISSSCFFQEINGVNLRNFDTDSLKRPNESDLDFAKRQEEFYLARRASVKSSATHEDPKAEPTKTLSDLDELTNADRARQESLAIISKNLNDALNRTWKIRYSLAGMYLMRGGWLWYRNADILNQVFLQALENLAKSSIWLMVPPICAGICFKKAYYNWQRSKSQPPKPDS